MSHETVFDRGLQSERTALAWSRNALSFLAVGVLLLRSVHADRHPLRLLPGLLSLLLALAVYLMARVRYRTAVRAARAGGSVAPPVTLVAGLAGLTLLLGALAAAAIVERI